MENRSLASHSKFYKAELVGLSKEGIACGERKLREFYRIG
jgi:hypothetical protein